MKSDLSFVSEKRFALPVIITDDNKVKALILVYIFSAAIYMAANRIHFFTPQELPFTWLDSAIPFLPNTIWIYISEYVFFLFVFINSKDTYNLNKYLFSFLSLQVVAILIFFIWPTTFPRDAFPLPQDLNALSHFAFATLRSADTPASCCPSLHVAAVYLSSFIFLDDQRHKLPYFLFWGTLIALSTLTTKQHYIVDVIAGFALAVVMYFIFHKLVPYQKSVKTS